MVSIIIPVFNGGDYLREAIDSALAQTYDNIEVLVINDGSTDGGETENIIEEYGNRIRHFTKENGGCGSALNVGIEQMKGDYFSWLSHDDRYLPTKVQQQVSILASLEDRDTVIYGGYELIDETSKVFGHVSAAEVLEAGKLNIPLYPLLRGLIHGCTLLIAKKHFETVGRFDESLQTTQDYALWFDLFRKAAICFDPDIAVQSRVHPNQSTHTIESRLNECNDLWIGFLNKLSRDEMVEMEGSPFRFLERTAVFLSNTEYDEAEKRARSMAARALFDIVVSVIIPFRNRVPWAIEAVSSVLQQTHQSFEIILIDDGSTDDISPLLEICQSDSRIRYFRQENSGPAKARNRGIELATGDYIAFLDADDLFCRDKLAAQLRYMEENEIELSHTSYLRMSQEGVELERVDSGTLQGDVLPGMISNCPIAMPTVMGKSEIFEEDRFPDVGIGEDVCLWIRLATKHSLGGLNRPLSKVRLGPSTAALEPRKHATGLLNIASFVINDPELCHHEAQVALLLRNAASLLSDDELKTSPRKTGRLFDTARSSLSTPARKLYESLRDDGVRATLRRIRRRPISSREGR